MIISVNESASEALLWLELIAVVAGFVDLSEGINSLIQAAKGKAHGYGNQGEFYCDNLPDWCKTEL